MVLSTLRSGFQRYPLLANVAIFTSLLGGADCACQIIQHKGLNFDYNVRRTASMAALGVVWYGPAMFYYYRLLDRKLPGRSPRTIITKMLIDQLIVGGPNIAIFYLGMSFFEGKSWEENKAELKKKFLPTYATGCLFWPTAQFINFTLLPPMFRVAYVSTMSFIWNIFLSYLKSRPRLPAILQYIEDFQNGPKSALKATE